MALRFSVATACLLAACGCSSGGDTPSIAGAPAAAAPAIALSPAAPAAPTTTSFTGLLNGVRADAGAGSVAYDSRLGVAAQGHADEMLANNYFSHTGLNGSDAGDRIRAAGYTPSTWGENIARGQQTEAEVLDAWQNSPGHRVNNLNPNFEDFALARAGSGSQRYWVLVLATEQ